MPLDNSATVQQNSCILSFLRVLRSDHKGPAIELGFFVRARNATAAMAGPNGTAWTLLAGSVVYGKTPAARAPMQRLTMSGARPDRRDQCSRVLAPVRPSADRWGKTHATRVAQNAPSPADGQGSIPWARPNSIRYVLLRTFARSLNRASPGLFF